MAENRAVYEELEDYIDEEYRDYEAFERGEQAVLVIQKGAAGEYVDTCKAGDTLSSSLDYFYWMNNNHSSYAVSELYQEYADYMQKMRFQQQSLMRQKKSCQIWMTSRKMKSDRKFRNFRKRYRKNFI